jgi:hypothetical protein
LVDPGFLIQVTLVFTFSMCNWKKMHSILIFQMYSIVDILDVSAGVRPQPVHVTQLPYCKIFILLLLDKVSYVDVTHWSPHNRTWDHSHKLPSPTNFLQTTRWHSG